jgi:glutamate N-acetyltransferase/amino-acid N-acetyltransferase
MAAVMSTSDFIQVDGGVTAARGFRAAGIRCGIKPARPDLALIVSDTLATAAGVFTTNAVKAAPVLVSMEAIQSGAAQAVVINSGNANACTGARGLSDAREMVALTAKALRIAPEFVLVASTGVIGVPLPMEVLRLGIPQLPPPLSRDGTAASEAILTTDAFTKTAAVRFSLKGMPVTVGGMAKGAGMIHPQMATTLCVITTDAAVPAPLLRRALRAAADRTFNCISVDGDTSTNDTIFLLANGAAGHAVLADGDPEVEAFEDALSEVAGELARMVVRDGEGATKLITVTVRGARSTTDAKRAVNAVMTSPLVKTALYGGEPNWGRVFAAVGRSGASVTPERTGIAIAGVTVVAGGVGIAAALPAAEEGMKAAAYEIVIDLGLGDASSTGWTCDLNEGYVKINAGYMT